ncbi:DUF6913 domain-containing protein [Croceibacter atlanticus]|uniref:DUF6913 domain-containing protein n=2 Tax=Croceibacter atlanticus TaxID=313588 RepID=UPI0032B2057F|tara:strand:- start:5757 stop:6275 length:519 start_codon:yes stop_codon:yes gene_type:complete
MVLNKMKRASIKRSIQKLTAKRVLENHNSKIEKVVCLIDVDAFGSVQELDQLIETLQIKSINFKVIGYSAQKKTIKTYSGLLLTNTKIGWKGVVKDSEIKDIIAKPTDLLINYYNKEVLGLELLSAKSPAKFKVGFGNVNPQLNDLIIGCDITDINTFKTEMVKYLKVLNKL